MEKKLDIGTVLSQGIGVGLKNLPSLLGAVILYLLTCWIPYVNVGTSIAMTSLPVELSKGKIISPLAIFDKKYFRYMGEYFLLLGFMSSGIAAASLLMLIPGIVISIAWSLALFLMLDKGVNPIQALTLSNKLTCGKKWTIFFIYFILCLVVYILAFIFMLIPVLGIILVIALSIVTMVAALGCQSVIYGILSAEVKEETTEVQA